MGRAGRPPKKRVADMLRELDEEGLPDGWEKYWQGPRDVIPEGPAVIDSLFGAPSIEIVDKIKKERLDPKERIEILASLQIDRDKYQTKEQLRADLQKDPLLEALLENEIRYMPAKLLVLFDHYGVNDTKLRQLWKEEVIHMVAEGYDVGWSSDPERNLDYVKKRPHSLLTAALTGPLHRPLISHDQLAAYLQEVKSSGVGMADYEELVYEEILPSAHAVLRGSPRYSLALDKALYKDLAEKLATDTWNAATPWDIEAQQRWFFEHMKDHPQADEFIDKALYSTRAGAADDERGNLYREFWSHLLEDSSHSILRPEDNGPYSKETEDMATESARFLMARYLLRVMEGVEESDTHSVDDALQLGDEFQDRWAEYFQNSRGPSPLDNLIPLLGEEKINDLVEELKQNPAAHSVGAAFNIRNHIYQELPLPYEWHPISSSDWGDEVVNTIRSGI